MTEHDTDANLAERVENTAEREGGPQEGGNPSHASVERQLRRAGALLLVGLLAQALSLLGLHTPMGFMAFAAFAGTFIALGMIYFLWAISRGSTTMPDS